MSREEIDKLVGQLEAEMRAAAKQMEFERAAALRDEIQDIRLRVLEEDASVAVAEGRGARGCASRRQDAHRQADGARRGNEERRAPRPARHQRR